MSGGGTGTPVTGSSVLASGVLTRVSLTLQDAAFTRWPVAELLGYLNEGQAEIALYKPNASIVNGSFQLAAGTKQALPSGGLMLIDLVRNMGTDGLTPGNAVRQVARGVLDAQVPSWHLTTASATVKHYMYSLEDPTRYYVYPPQPAASQGYVEVIYGATPVDVAANANPVLLPSGAISVADIYAPALFNYVMHRAYTKDAEYAADAQLSAQFYQSFLQLLQGKFQAEQKAMPTKGAA